MSTDRTLHQRSYANNLKIMRSRFKGSIQGHSDDNALLQRIENIQIQEDAGPAECFEFLSTVVGSIPQNLSIHIESQHNIFLLLLKNQAIKELKAFQQSIEEIKVYSSKNTDQYEQLISILNSIINEQTDIVPANIEQIVWLSDTIYRLNRLKDAKILNPNNYSNFNKKNLYEGRDELFKQGALLLGRLLKLIPSAKNDGPKTKYKLKDLPLLNHTLRYATAVIEDPENNRGALKALERNCNEIEGKPHYWKLFLGALLFVGGSVMMGLSLAGVAHTAGFSLFGFYAGKEIVAIGSGLIAASGIGFWAWGRRGGISKAAQVVADNGEKAQCAFKLTPSSNNTT